MEHVSERVVALKGDLFEFWAQRDESSNFHVTPGVWRQGMAEHIGRDFPWSWLQDKLGVVDQRCGSVPYLRFLRRFRVAQVAKEGQPKCLTGPGWETTTLQCVFQSLLLADLPIREALQTCA